MRIKQKYPRYFMAMLIALGGLGFLSFAVYYIVYLPVPVALQPLKVRVLTVLQLEQALTQEGFAVANEEINVYLDNSEESDILFQMIPGNVYEILEEGDEWIRVNFNNQEGWIKSENEN